MCFPGWTRRLRSRRIAAGTTAVLRSPFTAVLLVSLLMGASAFDVAPIAVLAAAIAGFVADASPEL
jgi:hypothetical protein